MNVNSKIVDLKCCEKNITRIELAKLIGCNPSTLIAKLKGRRDWKLKEIDKLSNILDVPSLALLTMDKFVIIPKNSLELWVNQLVDGDAKTVIKNIHEVMYGYGNI